MFNLELSEEFETKLLKLCKETPKVADKIISKATKKALNFLEKFEKESVIKRYTPDSNILKGYSKKIKNGEGVLRASSKRNELQHFNINSKKPERRTEKISGSIKVGSSKTFRTMFWAFYKKDGKRNKVGLFIRNSKTGDRGRITSPRTVSLIGMSKEISNDEIIKVHNIFNDVLRKELRKIL